MTNGEMDPPSCAKSAPPPAPAVGLDERLRVGGRREVECLADGDETEVGEARQR